MASMIDTEADMVLQKILNVDVAEVVHCWNCKLLTNHTDGVMILVRQDDLCSRGEPNG